jgi:pSer/pThr/pTyr-binding forkhead associated (FHA) protein
MDDTHSPLVAPVSAAPHLVDAGLPPFIPLRLLLHPGGLCVEMTKADTVVGRHSGADVRLSLPDVSRRHCRFVFGDGQWRVFDLNSLNGVFVNGERLTEAVVFHGDRIRIGSLTFVVEIGSAAEDGRFKLVAPRAEGESLRKAS